VETTEATRAATMRVVIRKVGTKNKMMTITYSTEKLYEKHRLTDPNDLDSTALFNY
jgi:hypothetical protein